MAKQPNRRLPGGVVAQDKECLVAIKGIKDYKPTNTSYKLADLQSARDTMETDQEKETQLAAEAKNARDRALASEWAFHDIILGAKDQVKAQYGANSDELQCVGLKKKSAYKTGRAPKKGTMLGKAA